MAKVIDTLLELHRIDLETRDVEILIERLPADLASTEQELAALEEKKAGIHEAAVARQVAADEANLQIKDLEGKIEKYQMQLNIAKTQKEYDTLKSEITAAREQIGELEVSALTAYEEADALQAQARDLDPEIQEAGARLEKARAELQDRLADLENAREKLGRQRAGQVENVPADALKVYEQVNSKHRGNAMALITDGICTLCNMKAMPQAWNLVIIGEEPQQCRSCGRILYVEDPSAN